MRNCKIILIYLSIFLFCLPAFGNVNDDLFKAIEDGDAKKVQSLLKFGASLYAVNKDGITPIFFAVDCRHAKPDVIKILVKAGANLNVRNRDNYTPLIEAFHEKPGWFSNYQPQPEVIKTLIECGADVEARESKTGMTVIMHAVISTSNFRALKILLEKADLNAKDVDNENILMYAACNSRANPETIKFLVKSGLDVNAKNNKGITALMYSARGKSAEAVKALINLGADVFAIDNLGYTALDYAKFDDIKQAIINAAK